MKSFLSSLICVALSAAAVSAKYGPDCGKGQCGAGLPACPSDAPCCSSAGYCGSTADYCSPAADCQSGCWAKTENAGKCGPAPNYECPAGFCCSQYGYCGKTEEYCSKSMGCVARCWDDPNVGRCGPNNECPKAFPCCSQYGYCGKTDAYCNPNKGCKAGCWGRKEYNFHGSSSSLEQAVAHDFYLYPTTSVNDPSYGANSMVLSQFARSLFECEELCALDRKCKYYSWFPSDSSCYGYTTTSISLDNNDDAYAAAKMYQHDCQRCQHSFLRYEGYTIISEFLDENSDKLIVYKPANQVTDCELECNMDKHCLAYSYRSSTQQCWGLKSKRVELVSGQQYESETVGLGYAEAIWTSGKKVKICTSCHDLVAEPVAN